MFCSKCGEENVDDALFCKKCGNQLRRPDSVNDVPSDEPSKEDGPNQKAIAIAIIAVAAIVLIVAVAMALGGRSASSGGSSAGVAASGQSRDGQAQGDHVKAEPVQYSYKTVVLDDSTAHGGLNHDQPSFTTLEFSCSQPNEHVDQINASLRAQAESALADKLQDDVRENPSPEQIDHTYYVSCNDAVTFFQDGIVCILHHTYTTLPVSIHGAPLCEAKIVNLESGAELSAAEAIGITDHDLRVMAWKAADLFIKKSNRIHDSAADAFRGLSERDGVPEKVATYYLTPDGIVAVFGAYEIADFATGTPALMVCDLNGNSIATGDRVDIATPDSGTMTIEPGTAGSHIASGGAPQATGTLSSASPGSSATSTAEEARAKAEAEGKDLYTGTLRIMTGEECVNELFNGANKEQFLRDSSRTAQHAVLFVDPGVTLRAKNPGVPTPVEKRADFAEPSLQPTIGLHRNNDENIAYWQPYDGKRITVAVNAEEAYFASQVDPNACPMTARNAEFIAEE